MAELQHFRELVTRYRKPYTQAELERTIGLPAGELSHRLHGTGRQPLTRQNVLDIVVTLAEWQGVKWKEAVELLEIMGYPLDAFEWKRRLQEHLAPPDLFLPAKGSSAGAASESAERTLPQPRHRLFHPPNRLEGYVPRPDIFQEIKRRVLEEGSDQTIGITTALRGAGGFGKTTLAAALCHDAEIRAAFPDILWIELGEQPPQALDLLNRLLAMYEDSRSEAITLQEAQERWHAVLGDRRCLLVIDDVWQPRWADLPQSEAYLWHHLVLHLCQASQQEVLQTTLTDLGYLTRKALYVGVSALETDLLLASTVFPTGTAEPASFFFASLHHSVVRISHQLRQTSTEAEIGGLLLSHFGWEATFASQRLSLEHELPRPFLTAWRPLPDRSSFALLRTLRGHTGEVHGCAVSPDGRFIVSASADQTLKVWDAQTGQYVLTFPVDGTLSSCTFHPDGEHLVAWGNQGMYFLRLVV